MLTNPVLEIPCDNRRTGEQMLRVNMLREGPQNYEMTPFKIRDLWVEASKHDVLFSDYTAGKLEPFIDVLMNPRGVWLEIVHGEKIIGAAYLSDVIPGFDASAHFTFWDSVASGREPLVLYLLEFVMDRYKLHRVSAKVPVYQKGVIRFVERVGFKREGTIRELIPYKGKWLNAALYGILRPEVEDRIEEIW